MAHFTIWSCFVTSHPRDHKMIGREELSILDYTCTKSNSSSVVQVIKDGTLSSSSRSTDSSSCTKVHVPWKALFTSPPVLSLLFFRFSFFWTFLMIMNKLPTYMNDILHVSPTEVGFFILSFLLSSSFHSLSFFLLPFILFPSFFFLSFSFLLSSSFHSLSFFLPFHC